MMMIVYSDNIDDDDHTGFRVGKYDDDNIMMAIQMIMVIVV